MSNDTDNTLIVKLTALSEASEARSALTRDSVTHNVITMFACLMSPEGSPALLVLSLGAGQAAATLVQGVEPGVAADRRLVTRVVTSFLLDNLSPDKDRLHSCMTGLTPERH